MLQPPNVTVLPGGRKVRDYSGHSVEVVKAEKAAESLSEESEEQPKKKPAKKAEDESLG
jgi:hypothetical protein